MEQHYKEDKKHYGNGYGVKHCRETTVGTLQQDSAGLKAAVQTDCLLNLQIYRPVIVRSSLVIKSGISQTHLFA